MRILYDHQIFSLQKVGGISRYFSELISELNDYAGFSCALPPLLSANSYVRSISRRYFKGLNKKNLPGFPGPFFFRLNRGFSRHMLNRNNFDVFHPTYFFPDFLDYLGNRPYVITVYDMIYERFPHYFPDADKLIYWKKILISRAKKIIAISRQTREDIVRFSGVDENRIAVVPLAGSLEVPDSDKRFQMNRQEKYLLYVGDRRYYKNFSFFIDAIAGLLQRNPGLHVVCAGGLPFSAAEVSRFRDTGITGRVFRLCPDDHQLALLYKNALALVYPSLFEGFGMPVLEAFACGCPVLASTGGALPETAGTGALYFDPHSPMSIRKQAERIISDPDLRAELRTRGSERSQCFSWHRTARETGQIYEQCS